VDLILYISELLHAWRNIFLYDAKDYWGMGSSLGREDYYSHTLQRQSVRDCHKCTTSLLFCLRQEEEQPILQVLRGKKAGQDIYSAKIGVS
jgi:hypothetical protein